MLQAKVPSECDGQFSLDLSCFVLRMRWSQVNLLITSSKKPVHD